MVRTPILPRRLEAFFVKYTPNVNLLLEALAFLGARANGYTLSWMEERLQAKGITDLSVFYQRYAPIAALSQELGNICAGHQEAQQRLFKDVEGFTFNTTGMYSPAFLLFFPFVGRYAGDLDGLLAEMAALSPDQAAQHILLSLGLDDGITADTDGCARRFMDTVFALTIPAESRLALLETHHKYRELILEVADCLRPVLEYLQLHGDQLQTLAEAFGQELEEVGHETHLSQTTSLAINGELHYDLRPFIFGSDSNLALEPSLKPGQVTVHCGILVRFLRQLFDGSKGSEEQVYEAIRLLGDQTRFEILCFLRDRPAYGSELSEQLGFARNTIHHHTSKLLNAGLITYTVEGNRICYSTNKARLSSLLAQQHHLLIGGQGW